MRPTIGSPALTNSFPSSIRATTSGGSRKSARGTRVAWAQAEVSPICGFDGGKHLFSVPFRLYFGEDLQQLPIRTDEEGSPLNPNHFLAVHILFLENVKLFANYFVYICKEGIGQVILLFEFLLRLGVSREIPRTTAPACCIFLKTSRKPQASMVHPGVSALG